MMGELVFGAERGLKWAVFWAADGTGYRDGLLRKTESGEKEKKKRRKRRDLQRGWGTFLERRTSAEEPEIEREAGLDLLTRDFLLVQV